MRIILYLLFLIATMFFLMILITPDSQEKQLNLKESITIHLQREPLYVQDNYSAPSKYWYAERYAGAKERTLKEFYVRRAYPGAPPIIPHPIEKNTTEMCLTCHEEGGYVPQYNAYAPITPHSDFISCSQCHVPQAEVKTSNLWRKTYTPRLQQKALLSSPPVIPHDLQMRENCLACHAGPAAVKEIRTDHPERIQCLQCHVFQIKTDSFRRNSLEKNDE